MAPLAFSIAGVTWGTSRALFGARLGLVDWARAMAAAGLAVLLYFLRGYAPSLLTYVGANLCVLGVPSFTYLAYSHFYGVRPNLPIASALCVAGMFGVVCVQWFGVQYLFSVVTVCGSVAGLFGLSAGLVLRNVGRKVPLSTILSATAISILTFAFGLRAVLAALSSNTTPVDRTVSVVFLLVSSSLFIGIASLAFVLMVQERYSREALANARRDGLTGLLTRAAFFESASEFDHAGSTYGLVVIDVDHFKVFNDTRGHACGDVVLAHLGRLVQRSIRTEDLAGRYGGEEFCVVLRGCGEEATRRFSERLVADAANQSVRLPDSADTLRLTISAGYAVRHGGPTMDGKALGSAEQVDQVFKRADEALYIAKRAGRNQAKAASIRGQTLAET